MRLIDADALIADCNVYNAWDAQIVKAWVDDQPTVDAVPVRHGKWMGTVCSACGESVSFWYDCDYCPCCGARMDEDETD